MQTYIPVGSVAVVGVVSFAWVIDASNLNIFFGIAVSTAAAPVASRWAKSNNYVSLQCN